VEGEEFPPNLIAALSSKGRKCVIIEGGIAAGKSYTITKFFPDNQYIKREEPIDQMNEVLKPFYEGKLSADKTSELITDMCIKHAVDGIEKAQKMNMDLVLERIAWLHKWVFYYPHGTTLASVKAIKKKILNESYNMEDPLTKCVVRDMMIGSRTNAVSRSLIGNDYLTSPMLPNTQIGADLEKKFDSIIMILLDPPMDMVKAHATTRGRDYEKNIDIGYLELIQARSRRLFACVRAEIFRRIMLNTDAETLVDIFG